MHRMRLAVRPGLAPMQRDIVLVLERHTSVVASSSAWLKNASATAAWSGL